MNYYETLYIVHPALDAGRLKDLIMGVEDSLKKMGGESLAVELWGKRKLAYFIDKQKYGTYVLLQFNGAGKCTGDFAVELEHNPNILAYLTTSIDKDKVIKQEEDIETQIAGKTREAERSEARKSGARKSEEKETDVVKTENLASDSTNVKKGDETSVGESEQIDSATEEKENDHTEDETPEESNDSGMDEEVDSPTEEKSDVQLKDEESSAEIAESESDEKNTTSEDFAEKESETNQEKAEDEPTAVSEEE